MATTEQRNRRGDSCAFCGRWVAPGKGTIYWCEDGVPTFCERHFDRGGWHVRCADRKACDAAREDDETAKVVAGERAKAEAEVRRQRREQAQAAWAATFERETAGLVETGYGPRADFQGREVLAELVTNERWGWGQTLVRLADGDLALVRRDLDYSATSRFVAPEQARQYRLDSAREMGVTVEDARKGIENKYVGNDQRAMYEAVIEEAKGQ